MKGKENMDDMTLVPEDHETISQTSRRAARLAIFQNTQVNYKFEGQTYSVSPQQAAKIFTPDDIKNHIDKLQADIELSTNVFQRHLSLLSQALEEEIEVARRLYPEKENLFQD